MGITYENQRVHFDKIVKAYKAYLNLYREINHGSVVGITTFDDFYWRMTYYSKYSDPKTIGHSGY